MLGVGFQCQIDCFLSQVDIAANVGDCLTRIQCQRLEIQHPPLHRQIANKALHLGLVRYTQRRQQRVAKVQPGQVDQHSRQIAASHGHFYLAIAVGHKGGQ